jgi:ABC-type multidrug transport system ATPase subunit
MCTGTVRGFCCGVCVVWKHEVTVVDTWCRNIVGYVQQQDVHVGTATVREALEFAAALRLPPSVTSEQRRAIVCEVLEMLDLTSAADWLVGDSDYNGISPSQRKRLTIGTELVANPSVLYVDEPTTGLDSRAAMVERDFASMICFFL